MDRIGRVVGSYEIVERIGEGGMGTVYRALDPMLEREVAVKAIRPELLRDPLVAQRFRAEAKLLARVNHPAIATIYSFFEDGGELFLAMEFVRGRTLAAALRERGAFPWQEAVGLLAAALPGIEQVHRLGIVHRDLKPDNLMLTEAGGLKVMDFGIARAADAARLTRTGLMVGTLRYMAPEQLRGEAGDRRSDLYALGAVLYEMLTGRVPFASDSEYEVIRAQVEEAPAPPSSLVPGLPAWLDAAVLRALAKDPAERFQSAEEMRAVLAGAGRPASQATAPQRTAEIASLPTAVKLSAAPAAAAAASSYRPVELARPRRPAAWIGLAAALIAVVALGLWALHARGEPATPAGNPAAGGP
ncbi:MAG TPA: serine/threonine-protein kinase, partial [Solirubrobacterales bacterium]|nr:serine/threonine-protein kinase [Solirubrobacterales bacterium]